MPPEFLSGEKILVLHVFLGDEPLTEGIERYLMRVKK